MLRMVLFLLPHVAVMHIWLSFPSTVRSTAQISTHISPNGAWSVIVSDRLCESFLVTDITTSVELASTVDRSDIFTILGVDTAGHADERPRIAWSGSDLLEVTVPNISFLKVVRTDFDGVRVVIRYDPDDLAARKAWRRTLGREGAGLDDP